MKRTLLLGSAWTASAAAAVGLGFLAVSLVDASASSGTATLTTSSGGTPTAVAPVTDSPAAETAPAGQQVTLGGTVYGSCENGVPVLASAPAAGWWLDDSNDVGEAEFENGTLKIEVKVNCVDGVPQFFVEGPRNDSSHGGEDRSTSSPSVTTSPSSGDDSDGRVGGGHGSDDGVSTPSAATTSSSSASASASSGDDSGSDDSGSDDSGSDDSGDDADDDSSGRSGGGHGSDD
jgi:hypothetical protein